MIAGPYSIGSAHWPGLSKLIEEAGEVCQVAGKILGTGGEDAHWDGTNLRDRLTDELADLAAAIDFVIAKNALDKGRAAKRKTEKLSTFKRWHVEQGGQDDWCDLYDRRMAEGRPLGAPHPPRACCGEFETGSGQHSDECEGSR